MEKHLKLDTLQDVQAIVTHYALDHFEWDGAGTALGFSHYLLARGGAVTLLQLSAELEAYRYLCTLQGTAAVDAQNDRETEGIRGYIAVRSQLRREAAAAIRHFKLKHSAVYWNALARLATVEDRGAVVSSLSADQCAGVLEAIEAVAPLLSSHFHACRPGSSERTALGYKPGADSFLDEFVRQDIERFDRTLETAAPCSGSREDNFEESAALYLLIEHTPVREELCAAIADLALRHAAEANLESVAGATQTMH